MDFEKVYDIIIPIVGGIIMVYFIIFRLPSFYDNVEKVKDEDYYYEIYVDSYLELVDKFSMYEKDSTIDQKDLREWFKENEVYLYEAYMDSVEMNVDFNVKIEKVISRNTMTYEGFCRSVIDYLND